MGVVYVGMCLSMASEEFGAVDGWILGEFVCPVLCVSVACVMG